MLLNRALVITATLLATAACEGGSTPSQLEPEATSTAVISYGGDGVTMHKPADVAKLAGAPEDFRNFMSGVIDTSVQNASPDEECPVTVRVDAIDPRGFATGGITSCGGYAAIWKRVDGVWRQVWGGQDYPTCRELKAAAVPPDLLENFIAPGEKAKCFDPKRNDVVPYRL